MEKSYNRKSGDRKSSNKRDGEGFGSGRRTGHRPVRTSIPKGTQIDFKNIAFLQKCLTERGKIFSRRLTGATAKEQRLLTVAVKRARFLGLLPVGSSRRK